MQNFKICPLVNYRGEIEFYVKKKVLFFWLADCTVTDTVGGSLRSINTFSTGAEAKDHIFKKYGTNANIVINYL